MPKDLQECGIPKIMFRSKYGELMLRVLAGAIVSLYAPPPGKSARENGPSGLGVGLVFAGQGPVSAWDCKLLQVRMRLGLLFRTRRGSWVRVLVYVQRSKNVTYSWCCTDLNSIAHQAVNYCGGSLDRSMYRPRQTLVNVTGRAIAPRRCSSRNGT